MNKYVKRPKADTCDCARTNAGKGRWRSACCQVSYTAAERRAIRREQTEQRNRLTLPENRRAARLAGGAA